MISMLLQQKRRVHKFRSVVLVIKKCKRTKKCLIWLNNQDGIHRTEKKLNGIPKNGDQMILRNYLLTNYLDKSLLIIDDECIMLL